MDGVRKHEQVCMCHTLNSLSAMDSRDIHLKTSFVVLWFLAKFLSVHGV
jgi:hypothetical protein